MATPQEYDLSYRNSIGGLFLPPEYISNFAAGDSLGIVRLMRNAPRLISGVSILIKPTQGAATILISKTVNSVLTADGEIQQLADSSWLLSLLFSDAETELLNAKSYFIVQVTYDDNSTEVVSNGYIRAGREREIQNVAVDHIAILNDVGDVSIGQFQIIAQAQDVLGTELLNVPIFYYVDSNDFASIDDKGLLNAAAAGTVVVTVGTPHGNLAQRATFVIA
jgi:hypothetical protein